jgi:hypothetical protein
MVPVDCEVPPTCNIPLNCASPALSTVATVAGVAPPLEKLTPPVPALLEQLKHTFPVPAAFSAVWLLVLLCP